MQKKNIKKKQRTTFKSFLPFSMVYYSATNPYLFIPGRFPHREKRQKGLKKTTIPETEFLEQ